jgi:heterodisulfide reductase subunit B2
MTTLAYYPGCSLKTSSRFYEASIRKVFEPFRIELKEIDDWSCCGASAAHTVDETLAHTLTARNLALAEAQDAAFFAPCSACYSRSKITNETMRDNLELQDELNRIIAPLSCSGTIEVKNIIEVLGDYVGAEEIARKTRYDLSGLKVVPYYGCVLTRLMRVKPYDDRENPESMDELLVALGTQVVDWPYKMECCGASKTLTNKEVTKRLSERIMDVAVRRGADAIVTPCPLCQMNLDLLPFIGSGGRNLPVLFLTEVFELAFFGTMDGASGHLIPTEGLAGKIKERK